MPRRVAWPPFPTNLRITIGILLVFWVAALEITGPGSIIEFRALLGLSGAEFLQNYMMVSSANVIGTFTDQGFVLHGRVWTLLTYAFWHADFSHLLFNGLALWMFGGELDRRWGAGWFWAFCLLCAVGGGVTVVVVQFLLDAAGLAAPIPTLGYSGAIMGLVAGYCWHNWHRELFFFFFRLEGKWLLPLFVLIDFFLVVGARQPISMSAHIGGMATGLLLVSGYWRPRDLVSAVKRWNAQRKLKKQPRTPGSDKSNGHW